MQNEPSTKNKIKEFIKKHKKPLIIAAVVYAVLMIGVLAWVVGAVVGGDSDNHQTADSSYTPPADKYPRVDVNGLSVQEACSRLQEKGWKVESAYGTTEDYKDSEVSDCTKANGTVTDVNYYGDSLSIYYTYTKDSSDSNSKMANTESEVQKSRYTVSEDAAEHYCQDAGLLNKYVDSNAISTVYISNYDKKYTDSFSFDENGNPIWYFQWNGRDQSSGEAVRFSCWISGSSDSDITLHWLSLGGQDLYGSSTFDSYKEDGTKRS